MKAVSSWLGWERVLHASGTSGVAQPAEVARLPESLRQGDRATSAGCATPTTRTLVEEGDEAGGVMNDKWIVLREGTWLYAGEVICDICILKHGWCYGSGDYEDEPEIREDREGEFYYVEFGVAGERGVYKGRSGCYESLEEALNVAAVATQNTVIWN